MPSRKEILQKIGKATVNGIVAASTILGRDGARDPTPAYIPHVSTKEAGEHLAKVERADRNKKQSERLRDSPVKGRGEAAASPRTHPRAGPRHATLHGRGRSRSTKTSPTTGKASGRQGEKRDSSRSRRHVRMVAGRGGEPLHPRPARPANPPSDQRAGPWSGGAAVLQRQRREEAGAAAKAGAAAAPSVLHQARPTERRATAAVQVAVLRITARRGPGVSSAVWVSRADLGPVHRPVGRCLPS